MIIQTNLGAQHYRKLCKSQIIQESIAVNAGISESELSRFKNGVDALKESDMKLLADYLNVVYIPRWNKGEKESGKPRIEKVKSTRHWLFM